MKKISTIVLAAGKGTRMKSESPKVLHKVGGQPILQYVLDIAQAVGSLKTWVVVGHKSEAVRKYLPAHVGTVLQKKLLGTADAVRSCESVLRNHKGDVLILCGDTPLLKKETVKKILSTHRRTKSSLTFLTAVVEEPFGYGRIIRDYQGQTTAIREHKDASPAELDIKEINVGVYCFNVAKLFKALKDIKLNPNKKEFYLTDIVELFYKKGSGVRTVVTEDFREGLGVNNREDLAASEDILRQRTLKNLMISGVTIVDPNTTFIDAGVKIGADTIIRPCSVIEGDVVIGKRCVIGPFARLRKGSRIGNDVEIGNFTEVNRSKISDNTLMKHFSYLGDAIVGRKVNIGAGTVTANYDGKNKNNTWIADEAFIGSDSVLVAPVRIGKKAVVGAGSVVTRGKTIPAGALAVGVPARIISKRK